MKIIVIGAGSVGSHVAYRLQDQGAEVVLLDASNPGGGTTSNSIAMLNDFPQRAWDEEAGRAKMRTEIHSIFKNLADEVPGDYMHLCGSLMWVSESEEEEFLRLAEIAQSRGVDVSKLTPAQAKELEPGVNFAANGTVYLETDSGWVDGPGIVKALNNQFIKIGGVIRQGARVVAINRSHERVTSVVLDSGEKIEADTFVNAAGSWGSHIAAMAGTALPLELIPGVVVYTQPFAPGKAPQRIINTPIWCGRPDPSGGLAIHWRGHSQTAHHGSNVDNVEQMMSDVGNVIPELAGTLPARESVGIRPIPPGGPIIGSLPWLPNMYHTLSHGGIGWGPMWGWCAAREILKNEVVPELSGLRPERFYLTPSQIGRHADDAEQTAH